MVRCVNGHRGSPKSQTPPALPLRSPVVAALQAETLVRADPAPSSRRSRPLQSSALAGAPGPPIDSTPVDAQLHLPAAQCWPG